MSKEKKRRNPKLLKVLIHLNRSGSEQNAVNQKDNYWIVTKKPVQIAHVAFAAMSVFSSGNKYRLENNIYCTQI